MKRKTPPKQAVAPPRSWTNVWLAASAAALAFAVYANSLSNGFVSDDNFQLLNNPLVTDWRYLPVIFSTNVWAFSGAEITNYYRPFQMLLYMALYYLQSKTFDAFTFHMVMVTIHVINTVLVFLLGKRLVKESAAAWVAAALFAVHPIHTEAVVWVAVLPDVLITMMMLGALLVFSGASGDRDDGVARGWRIAVHAGIYFLCLLTKETGVMMLPLFVAYEWLYRRRPLGKALWDNRLLYGAMLASFAVYAALRIRALGGFAPAQNFYYHLTPTEYFLSVVVTLGEYLAKLVAPIHLNYYHLFDPTRQITGEVVAALIACVAAFVLWIAGVPELGERLGRWRPHPLVAFGAFWTLAPLAPVMNLTGVGENVFTERYLYLPSVGFVFLIAVFWTWLWQRQKQVAWGLCALCVAAGSYGTVIRNPDWSDDITLFSISAKQSPRSGTLFGNLGWFYYQRGRFEEAVEMYHRAIVLQPETALFYNNLGNALAQMGKREEAVAALRKAIQMKARYFEAWMNLGLALEGLGDIPGAVDAHQKALAIRPDYAESLTALALIRMHKENNRRAAIELLEKAIAARPLYTEAYINLGVCYNEEQQWSKAVETFQNALRVGQNYPSIYIAHYNLGISYSRLDSPEAAFGEFRTALQLRPDFAPAKQALDNAAEVIKKKGQRSTP